MTTNEPPSTAGTEIIGDDIRSGYVIGLRDTAVFGRYEHQYVVVIVVQVLPIRPGFCYIEGLAVMADGTDVYQPTMPEVATAEPVDHIATMPPSDSFPALPDVAYARWAARDFIARREV